MTLLLLFVYYLIVPCTVVLLLTIFCSFFFFCSMQPYIYLNITVQFLLMYAILVNNSLSLSYYMQFYYLDPVSYAYISRAVFYETIVVQYCIRNSVLKLGQVQYQSNYYYLPYVQLKKRKKKQEKKGGGGGGGKY